MLFKCYFKKSNETKTPEGLVIFHFGTGNNLIS